MPYLSPADAITIHQVLIARFGGMPGITEAGFGRLEAAMAAPQASAFGMEVFDDLPSKAAALCFALVQSHPFSDGNKRVALVALDLFLAISGVSLTATNDEAYVTIMAVASGQMSRDTLILWVRDHWGL